LGVVSSITPVRMALSQNRHSDDVMDGEASTLKPLGFVGPPAKFCKNWKNQGVLKTIKVLALFNLNFRIAVSSLIIFLCYDNHSDLR
jgi:hypothetical protein